MKIIECPRDAMQGIKNFIPSEKKILYINQLLKVGFDTIDFGSFVSPKAIPQLKDTALVIEGLELDNTSSKLLAIIANIRGAVDACAFQEINNLGFPLSVSEIFQKRNTNKSIDQALNNIEKIHNLCINNHKDLIVYLSMAFGNPYNEKYHPDIVAELTERLFNLGIRIVALSDTIGVAHSDNIAQLFSVLISEYPQIEFGAHFHTTKDSWEKKIQVAFQNGCQRFDGALKGYGGCPMAKDELVGNMPTEYLLSHFAKDLSINYKELEVSLSMTNSIF